ncbi:MAG TPA: hypothetical protein VHU80_19500, partial [Polyangiaceae bacterium]|nr:hypothetical protein [Polyangiaceae bacterium]
RSLLAAHRTKDSLSLAELADCLSRAFDAPVPSFDAAWRNEERVYENTRDHAHADRRLKYQIVDLREMDESGALKDEMRYFGKSTPRGSRWYNFDPLTYLECGARGAFGGWEEGDDTGVEYVPGEVMAFGPDGKMVAIDPRDVPHDVEERSTLQWSDVASFLGSGQCYE